MEGPIHLLGNHVLHGFQEVVWCPGSGSDNNLREDLAVLTLGVFSGGRKETSGVPRLFVLSPEEEPWEGRSLLLDTCAACFCSRAAYHFPGVPQKMWGQEHLVPASQQMASPLCHGSCCQPLQRGPGWLGPSLPGAWELCCFIVLNIRHSSPVAP